jgi:uncharacterized membrane protein
MFWKPISKEEEFKITRAIADAEKGTSGEIRVHIDRYCKTDPLLKAKNLFVHLKMDQTDVHNGVLIYVSVDDKKYAILGDKGINELVEPDFWDSTSLKMAEGFKSGSISAGIVAGVIEAGQRLTAYFPRQDNDKNELPDEISFS